MDVTRNTAIIVVPNRLDFAEALEHLQRVVYNGSKEDHHPDALHAEHFRSQVTIFPEGQFVAIDPHTGRIVGHTSSMLLHYTPGQPFTQPWVVTTDYGRLTPHDPLGDWMYGVESAVLPDYQGRGVGSALYAARFALAQQLNLRGMIAGSTIMNYHQYVDRMTPDEYVNAVVAGLVYDNNLTKQLKKGFRVLNVIPDYVSDELSCGYGAAILWDNPAYDPSQPSPLPSAA